MKKRILLFLYVCFFSFGMQISNAQDLVISKAQKARLDSLFLERNTNTAPGMSVGVLYKDKFIYKNSFGLARLNPKVPFSFDTRSYLASCSKQFTAFAILLLEADALLNIDDDVREYLTDFPFYGDTIRIYHLLHHTSGIRDFLVLQSLRGKSSYEDEYTDEEIYRLLINQKGLNFSPGERSSYSNSGYFLLKLIIQKVSGLSFKEFVKTRIFRPLKMNKSYVLSSAYDTIPFKSSLYQKDENNYHLYISTSTLQGPGGIVSSQEDLGKWIKNFFKPVLGSSGIIEKMSAAGILNGGKTATEACGLVIENYKKRKYLYHTGGNKGTSTCIMMLPQEELALVILSNQGGVPVEGLAFDMTNIILENAALSVREKTQGPVYSISPEKFSMYKGVYLSEDGDLVSINPRESVNLSIAINGGSERIIHPTSATYFDVENRNWKIIFEENSGTDFGVMKLITGADTLLLRRYLGMDWEKAGAYTGQFFSEELQVSYLIALKNDHLEITLKMPATRKLIFPVLYELETGLLTDGQMTYFRFTKKESESNFSEIKIIDPRARNVLFLRK